MTEIAAPANAASPHAAGHAEGGHGHPKHDYHLVDPSIWPLVTAFSVGTMAIGAVLWFHQVTHAVLYVGVVLVLFCMAMWFRDIVKEAVVQRLHTKVVQIGLRYGMALFIASEVMFFAAFFWAFFDSSLFPKAATGGVWPPKGITPFDPFHFPFLNTLILLLSGTTVTWAHHALIEGDRKSLLKGLALTVVLGICFTSLQAIEYGDAEFGFKGNIFGATFFMATGFHGFHVIVGTIFLATALLRAWLGQFTIRQHFGFEAAAWYWHFVDVVWLFLFVAVYWWGGNG